MAHIHWLIDRVYLNWQNLKKDVIFEDKIKVGYKLHWLAIHFFIFVICYCEENKYQLAIKHRIKNFWNNFLVTRVRFLWIFENKSVTTPKLFERLCLKLSSRFLKLLLGHAWNSLLDSWNSWKSLESLETSSRPCLKLSSRLLKLLKISWKSWNFFSAMLETLFSTLETLENLLKVLKLLLGHAWNSLLDSWNSWKSLESLETSSRPCLKLSSRLLKLLKISWKSWNFFSAMLETLFSTLETLENLLKVLKLLLGHAWNSLLDCRTLRLTSSLQDDQDGLLTDFSTVTTDGLVNGFDRKINSLLKL